MIQVGLLKFETSNKQEGVESQLLSSFKVKVDLIIQAVGIMEEMPTAMKGIQNDETKGKGIVYSSAIVRPKE